VVIREPDGTETTYTYGTSSELVRTSQGHYRVDIEPDQAGTHRFRWTSTGTGKASEEGWFQIRHRRVT
jgi:hypothetical protein